MDAKSIDRGAIAHDLKEMALKRGRFLQANVLIQPILSRPKQAGLKKVAANYGFKLNTGYSIEIISADDKYLFNYFSGAFNNNDLKKGAENLPKFISDSRFTDRISRLSGRAVYHKKFTVKVAKSLEHLRRLGYPAQGFISRMHSFCGKVNRELAQGKGVIILGIPREGEIATLGDMEYILAHEIFHLLLFKNGIYFEGIDKKYAPYDEGLAILLGHSYMCTEHRLDKKRNKNEEFRRAYWWKNNLAYLTGKERAEKIKKVHLKMSRE
jgi:hypothetical protein